jgi:hypothetical protein
MKFANCGSWTAGALMALCVLAASGQTPATTTVSGTVYLADGQAGSGTLVLSWPAFTTAAGQLIAADSLTVTIPANGSLSVNLAPNQGATPAGEYYTAVFYMSDGSVHTQYWIVPATTTATLSAVQAQVMPAAQAVQAVSKAYVDQSIAELASSQISPSGGTLTGPLYLSGDPTQPLQAADKHYVDASFSQTLPLTGGALSGPFTATQIGAAYQVDQFSGADFGGKLQACLSVVSAGYGGICDARNFTGTLPMASSLTIAAANVTVLLPCATIATANQVIVAAGTRNVSLRGCALRGGSAATGSQGGTVFAYSGAAAAIQVGDPTYAVDTPGFHLDNAVINTTPSTSATAQGFVAYRTQELDLESLYLLGNGNQTGITLDGTGNYTGGTFLDVQMDGFGTALNAIGHQVANAATTDWMNASTFVRLHIDCPTSSGSPISGTYGINLQQGDGNTFTGGDVEGCATALHLGANAQNNTIVGLRNENSTNQIVADAGSAYNNWITGGTMFTGKLTDNGNRNSFLDTFHRSFNGLNGDQYRSQVDGTVTNHYYLGIGLGNVRGLTDEYTTDVPGTAGSYQNAWQWGPGDGGSGQQVWSLLDMLNNVQRFGVQQNTTAGGSPQSYLNAAGAGIVCFQCSTNAGTGGVAFGSGGATPATVATINNAGNAQFNGTLQVGGTTQSTGTLTVRNNADTEVDYYLWPGLTASQKGSFTYKDWNGNSQWYLVKDASNNWALNSAVGGLDSFKAYQSTNSGDTYINASNSSGHIRLNYESGSGVETDIYSNAALVAAFLGTASIKFPGLAASSATNCLQIDNSGYLSNTGSACGTSSGSGTVNAGSSGQIAYYNASGSAVSGENTVTVAQGGLNTATAPASAQIPIAQSSTAYAPEPISQDASVTSAGVWTNTGIEGAAVPASATVLGTNPSAQLVPDATTGSGSVVLAGAPTFTGNATTFANNSANTDSLILEPGSSGNAEIGALEFATAAGSSQWELRDDTSYNFHLRNTGAATAADVLTGYSGGQTVINSQGTASVAVNNTSTAGTGGFIVYEGGSNYNTQAFTVSNNGTATATYNVSVGNHLNQGASSDFAGTCAMSSSTSCTFSLNHSFTSAPICVAGVQGSSPIAGSCALSGTTVTVYAASSNSSTWGAVLVGNPN